MKSLKAGSCFEGLVAPAHGTYGSLEVLMGILAMITIVITTIIALLCVE